MSVNSIVAFSGPYIAAGAVQNFPFDFIAASADEIALIVNGEHALPGTYSVALEDDGTGAVTASAPVGAVVYIESAPEFTQTAQFNRFAPYFPDTINKHLDRAAIRDIALRDKVDRAFAIPRDGSADGMFPVVLPGGMQGFASGTGSDSALRTDLANPLYGAALAAFKQSGSAFTRTVADKLRERVSAADFGVNALTTPAYNVAAIQLALDLGFAVVEVPDFSVTMSAEIQLKINGQRLTGKGTRSKLVKSDPNINRLIYAEGLTDVGVESLYIDGARDQTANFIAERWCVFFRLCVRPFVKNCYITGALTDNVVFELCTDPEVSDTTSNDSNKGGFYWSACEGGKCTNTTADGHGASATNIGNGYIVSNTWGLSFFGIKAKNNIQGQMIFSRGNRDIHVNGATLGDRRQGRGAYSIYMIGETTTGTVHGTVYDGETLYGTDDCTFSNVVSYLPPLLNYARRIDFFNLKIDATASAQVHAAIFGFTDRIRIRESRIATSSTGVGVSLNDFGGGVTTNLLLDAVDMAIPSGTRIFSYSGVGASWKDIDRFTDGVLAGSGTVANLPITATTGSIPVSVGAVSFADANAPSASELLKFGVEINAKLVGLLDRLRAQGRIDV